MSPVVGTPHHRVPATGPLFSNHEDMMTPEAAYATAVEDTLVHEGGWYDGSGSHDPNPTMYGVIQKNYDTYRDAKGLPRQTVRNISQDEVRAIYSGYWTGPKLDVVAATHPLTAMCLFDMSINAGPGTAARILQRAVGTKDDGKIGPMTLAALQSRSDRDVCLDVCFERLAYYVGLCTPKGSKHRPSLLSWTSRVLSFRRKWLKGA